MDLNAAIEQLDKEWELDTGFFGKLRHSDFDPEGAERVISLLETIASIVPPEEALNRTLVRLTWFMPTFMSYQLERVERISHKGDELNHIIDRITTLLYEILGVP